MSDQRAGKPARSVNYEDVDDVIGLAAEMKNADEGQLSVEDVKSVAAEVGVPAPYVERALTELERRKAQRAAEGAKHKRRAMIAAAALAVLGLGFAAAAVTGANALRASLATAEQKRSQVENVTRRLASVVEERRRLEARRHANADAQTEADTRIEAEYLGAMNRVSIETRRYDVAASEYNARAASFPGSLWAKMFGLPGSLELGARAREGAR